MTRARAILRSVFERLPGGVRDDLKHRRAVVIGMGQMKRNHAMLTRRVAALEQAADGRDPAPARVVDPRFPESITSRVCTQVQLSEPWYQQWCAALGEPPRANRKLWEHAYIAHALDTLDQLRPGRSGVGFGVGREPLAALFASRGCTIVATDLPSEAEEARSWANVDQHAGDLAGLLRPDICEPAQLHERVSWRSVDMRSPPADLRGFDFCWSACSLEHLGSLAKGFEFVQRSMATLVPGGVAVHTTEYNSESDDATVASGHTVLHRRRNLEELVGRLETDGHEVAALDLRAGSGVLDEYVDLPPYVEEPHLRLWYKTFTTTSVALVIRAGGGGG